MLLPKPAIDKRPAMANITLKMIKPTVISNEEDLVRRKRLANNDYLDKQLNENLPKLYVIVNSTFILVLSMAMIVLQLFMIKYKAINSHVASGVWCGIFFIYLASCDFSLVLYRRRKMFNLIRYVHLLATLMAQFSIVFLNIYSLRQYEPTEDSANLKLMHYLMIPIGICCAVSSSVFVLVLRIRFRLMCKSCTKPSNQLIVRLWFFPKTQSLLVWFFYFKYFTFIYIQLT